MLLDLENILSEIMNISSTLRIDMVHLLSGAVNNISAVREHYV